MGDFGHFFLLVLVAVHQGDCNTNFNDYKTLHPKHVHLDWMKCIPNDKSLSAVSIPGTHQSLKRDGLNPYRNFQAWELPSQLQAGVRFFDMSLSKSFGTLYADNNAIFYKEKFSHALSQLQIFVQDKTSEALLLRLSGPADAISGAKQELDHFTTVQVWKNRKIPKMVEARGKIVLVQSSDFDWGLPVNAMVLNTDGKEFQMKANIKKASEYCANEMMLTDTGAKGTYEYPKNVAGRVNKHLDDHLLGLSKAIKKPSCLGIFAIDFPGPKLIEVIINFSCGTKGDTDQISDTGRNGVVALNETVEPGPPLGTTPEPVSNPAPGPSPEPVSNPAPGPSPEPVPNPAPGPSPEPVSNPAPGPSPEPVSNPAPGPSPEPVPNPAPGPSPEPVSNPAPGPSPEPVPNPAPGPSPEPVSNPAPGPSPEPVPNPAPKPSPEPVSNPAPGPSPEPVSNPAPGPSPEPVSNPAPGPSPEPVPNPAPGPSPEPVSNPAPGPSPEPVPNPAPGPSPEPVPNPAPGPSPEPVPNPAPGPSPEPVPNTPAVPKPVRKRKKKCRRVHRRKPSPLVS